MFRKLFGPYPDEPLMYCLDRILGLLIKFDITDNLKYVSSNPNTDDATLTIISTIEINSKNEKCVGENKIIDKISSENKIIDPIVSQNIIDSIITDASDKVQPIHNNENISKTSNTSSHRVIISDDQPVISIDMIENKPITVPKTYSSLRKLVKKTSSMECLYNISESKIVKNVKKLNHTFAKKEVDRKDATDTEMIFNNLINSNSKSKRLNHLEKSLLKQQKSDKNTESKSDENTESKCLNDYLEVLQKRFERKAPISEAKHPQIEKVKQTYEGTFYNEARNNCKIIANCKETTNASDKSGIKLLTFSAKKTKFIAGHPKVIKTEWACTRIHTFDDNSQTYEVMTKDDSVPVVKNKSIQRIFAISPNSTTVAYRPLNYK